MKKFTYRGLTLLEREEDGELHYDLSVNEGAGGGSGDDSQNQMEWLLKQIKEELKDPKYRGEKGKPGEQGLPGLDGRPVKMEETGKTVKRVNLEKTEQLQALIERMQMALSQEEVAFCSMIC